MPRRYRPWDPANAARGSTFIVARQFLCKVADLSDGEQLTVDLDPPVAVYRVEGEFFATEDSCTHQEWSLGEEGVLEGYEVLCSLHMAKFDVRDGKALCLPATRALQTYPVEVVDEEVYADVT
jgi:nitrite reductase/ring-hydroxylating ferredoxin subunit